MTRHRRAVVRLPDLTRCAICKRPVIRNGLRGLSYIHDSSTSPSPPRLYGRCPSCKKWKFLVADGTVGKHGLAETCKGFGEQPTEVKPQPKPYATKEKAIR